MAREVTVGSDGLANGVSYINKNTGADEHVRAEDRRARGKRARVGTIVIEL
jgi:hypothetical protein